MRKAAVTHLAHRRLRDAQPRHGASFFACEMMTSHSVATRLADPAWLATLERMRGFLGGSIQAFVTFFCDSIVARLAPPASWLAALGRVRAILA